MKKSVVAALTGALVVGATATTFAAANPFSDVPAGHWAYNSVTKLASEGIIEGYGDGTFLGNRNITRYEMAQMIAKAMAKNPSGATKAELDKLAAEFRAELDSLGVRVAELEKHADKVQWTGKIEYTYGKFKNKTDDAESASSSGGVFRLEPKAEVNEHWTANARFDAGYDFQNDTTDDVTLKRVFAEGTYDKFQVRLGRFGFYPTGDGVAIDTVVSGGQLVFGSKWKFAVTGGRISGAQDENDGDWNEAGYLTTAFGDGQPLRADLLAPIHPSNVVAIDVNYEPGENGFFGGVGYFYAKNPDFGTLYLENGTSIVNDYYSKDGTDKANIWAVDLGYKFNDMATLKGSFAQNTKADIEKDGWKVLLQFGKYGDYAEQGDWGFWAGYSKFGNNVAIASDQGDDIRTGTKGWHVGAAYAPFKNVGLLARYADGKYLFTGDKYRKIFGRVEFFF